ncbi:MAG: cell division protein FtsQ [Lachnospiraceae bacterium]|nr:cell division protein FtsQ [Lachnospiraceae bacterium]
MRKDGHKGLRRLIIVLALIALLLLAFLYLREHYMVTEVHVTGNTRYTEEEIKDFVMSGFLGDNSLYLSYRYRDRPIKDIPFIERIDVEVESPHVVTIAVYEKAIAGYVNFLDYYMYFDRDGIIVESSTREMEGVPQVTGLEFRHCIVNEPLPVDNPKVFDDILAITQLLTKYDIMTDRIFFAGNGSITLFFGDARVAIGTMDNIDEKMVRLKYIVPELDGLVGVLHMENYSEDNDDTYITFDKDYVEDGDKSLSQDNFPEQDGSQLEEEFSD